MRNAESDEKERESDHFVGMCDTVTNDETDTGGSSNTAEHVENIRPRRFWGQPLLQKACWFYADGNCKSGDKYRFNHDGPLTRKGKSRARRNSTRVYASSSCNSILSEEADRKD